MPGSMQDYKDEYMYKTDWWTRIIVLLLIGLGVIFVKEVLEIYREFQSEPAFVIAMVGGVLAGEFSIMYFIFRNKKDIVRESIRFEHDYEMIPMVAETEPHDRVQEEYGGDSGMGEGFEEVFK